MPMIFHSTALRMEEKSSPVPEFCWHTSEHLSQLCGSKHLIFDVRSLDPGKYSYPYHLHRVAEELFVILSGSAMLRTPKGFSVIAAGDVVFFETGDSGAHQLYNHTGAPCLYLDIRTRHEVDVCEYPDSGKLNVLPGMGIFEKSSAVDYFKGESDVSAHWPEDLPKGRE